MLLSKTRSLAEKYPHICLGFAGALYAFAMPPLNLWPLAFIAFASVIFLTVKAPNAFSAAFRLGLFFFVFHTIALHWISNALLVDWQAHIWLLPFSFFGLPFLLALIPFFVSYACFRVAKHHKLWAFPVVLLASEGVRAWAFTGFPWNMPAHIWQPDWPVAASASVIGMMGVSLLTCVLLFSVGLIGKWSLFLPFFFIPLLALVLIRQDVEHTTLPDMHIIGVQPNIPQAEKWSPNLQMRNLNRRLDLSEQAIDTETMARLIIWPETALSNTTRPLDEFQTRLRSLLGPNDVLLSGYLGYNPDTGFNNSALLLNRDSTILAQYKKFHLVPFGETVPFSDILPIGPLVGIEGFEKGHGPDIIFLPNGVRIQPLICYEAIFPWHTRQDADILVNITNDAWYGNGWGPRQHLSHVAWRALETGKPLIRIAGTGISAVIDGSGEIRHSLPYNTKGVITGQLPQQNQ